MKELELLRAGRAADALAALLSRWRSTRTPVLGDAIVALGARSTDDPAAELEGKKGKDVEQRWVDLARGATDAQLSAYLAALSRHVATARFTWPIVELLAEREPDPRVAHFALETLQRIGKLRHASTKLGRRLVECVETHGDASFAAPLRKCRVTGWVQPERVKNVAARLERSGKPFEATKKELTSLLAAAKKVKRQPFGATAAPADTGAKLLAAVYANPADDAPRLVYADWLLERNDPRGELISLQFQRRRGEGTPATEEREKELLKRHGKAWLGPLAPVISFGKNYSGSRFERGFLAVADIILSVGKKLEPLMTDPAWATVEELQGSFAPELLETAPLRGLRRVDRQLGRDQLERLRKRREPLAAFEHLSLNDAANVDRTHVLGAFPHLRSLETIFEEPTLDDVLHVTSLGARVVSVHPWARRPPGVEERFAALVAALEQQRAEVDELRLTPPYAAWPRPAPVVLKSVDGRYARVTSADA